MDADYAKNLEDNTRVYKEEMARSGEILKQNRHSTYTNDWFGPDPEPNPPGKDCNCPGCKAVRWADRVWKSVTP